MNMEEENTASTEDLKKALDEALLRISELEEENASLKSSQGSSLEQIDKLERKTDKELTLRGYKVGDLVMIQTKFDDGWLPGKILYNMKNHLVVSTEFGEQSVSLPSNVRKRNGSK